MSLVDGEATLQGIVARALRDLDHLREQVLCVQRVLGLLRSRKPQQQQQRSQCAVRGGSSVRHCTWSSWAEGNVEAGGGHSISPSSAAAASSSAAACSTPRATTPQEWPPLLARHELEDAEKHLRTVPISAIRSALRSHRVDDRGSHDKMVARLAAYARGKKVTAFSCGEHCYLPLSSPIVCLCRWIAHRLSLDVLRRLAPRH